MVGVGVGWERWGVGRVGRVGGRSGEGGGRGGEGGGRGRGGGGAVWRSTLR